MKLTEHKRKWIQDKVVHYCSLLQVEVPTLLLTRKEYKLHKEVIRQETGYTRVGSSPSRVYGTCNRKRKVIFLHVKKTPNSKWLDDTIRHELIHYAKPSYNHHSPEFRDRMKLLKKGRIVNGRFTRKGRCIDNGQTIIQSMSEVVINEPVTCIQ